MGHLGTPQLQVRTIVAAAAPAVQVADLMQGGCTVATMTPTDTGLRLVSHRRMWAKPRWSKTQPNGVDVEFATETDGDR